MKNQLQRQSTRGVTLIELTLVIMIMLIIASAGFYSFSAYSNWQKGSEASQVLKKVYIAQRLYLADNPSVAVATLTEANLLSYLQDSPATFPTVEDKDGTSLAIDVTVTPPVVVGTDPSGNTSDSLWDVGAQ